MKRGLTPRVLAATVVLWAASAGAQNAADAEWSPGSSSLAEPELFPVGFRGSWGPSAEACRDMDGVERMNIYPGGVEFYEGGGRLIRITQSGEDRTVRVKLSFEGEGAFWEAVWLVRLEPGAALLRVREGDAAWKAYQRCN